MGLKNGLFCSWLAHGCCLLVPARGARLVASSASLGVCLRFVATSSDAQTPQRARGLHDGRRYYVDIGNRSCVAISRRSKWPMVRSDRLCAACFRALVSVSDALSIAVLDIGNVPEGSEPDAFSWLLVRITVLEPAAGRRGGLDLRGQRSGHRREVLLR